jgi:Ran GTPase-activating protein 1
MAAQGKSLVTDIEYLSKTRNIYLNELSFAGLGLKLNTRDDVKDIVSQILKKEKIQVLRLEGNTISPEAADELSKALVKHPELERFIGNDIFTSRSKEEIPPALKSICGSLELCGAKLVEINMSDNAFGPIGLDALVSFFQSSCCYSLKEIRMHNNGLGPQGATKFAHALDKCYENSGGKLALRVFVCGRNRLEFEGARTIGNTLKTMGTLEEIQMPQNGIRPNAIEFLAEACANNPSLRVINFNDNTFRKIGAVLMGKSLDKLNHVEYINFGDCLIRSKGALEIARALQSAKNLKEVILSFNEISLQAGIEIAQSFLKNKDTLKMLDLNGNKFGEEGKLEIKQILQPLDSVLCTLR